MPKISIVLPCYNGERFLSDSLNSIIQQTMQDWELIIVNDCSTDNSAIIAEKYAKQDKRIQVIHNKTNRKLPGSLNVGFKHATGKYLTWTSDDNICKPNWLQTLSDYLDAHPDTDMVSANMDMIDENGNVYDTFKSPNDQTNYKTLAYACNIGAAFMYRKEIADKIGKYDEDMFCAEDYDYWVRIALNGKIDYINDNIYQYRKNQKSLTATQQPRILAKTAAIQNKYKKQWIKKLRLNWWQRKKLDYLLRNRFLQSEFSLVGIRHTLVRQSINAILFWKPDLRRKLKKHTEIKL